MLALTTEPSETLLLPWDFLFHHLLVKTLYFSDCVSEVKDWLFCTYSAGEVILTSYATPWSFSFDYFKMFKPRQLCFLFFLFFSLLFCVLFCLLFLVCSNILLPDGLQKTNDSSASAINLFLQDNTHRQSMPFVILSFKTTQVAYKQ